MRLRRLTLGIGLFTACTLTVLVPGDGGWLSYEHAEFRAVRKGEAWLAFDRGERPEIDGYPFRDPERARQRREEWRRGGVRTTLPQRNEDQGDPDLSKVPFVEMAGTIEERLEGVVLLKQLLYVPCLERGEASLHHVGGRAHDSAGAVKPAEVSDADVLAARREIARYLDERYAGTKFGDELRAGLGYFVRLRPGWTTVVIVQGVALLLVVALIVSSFRKRAPTAA